MNDGKKQVDICREHDIVPSTVATILKDRKKILKLHRESQPAPSRKRLRQDDYRNVHAATLTWFKDARHHGVPLSCPIIHEKARQFAVALGTFGFDVSAGWLYQFWQSNDIVWQVVCGEEKATYTGSAFAWWNKRFQETVESLRPDVSFQHRRSGMFL